MLKVLLKNGIDANRKTEVCVSSLCAWAASCVSARAHAHSATPAHGNSQDGASLLHVIDASRYNPESVEVTKLVLSVPGLDINEEQSGYPKITPLQNVSMKQGPVAAEVAQLLINAGADVNAATKARAASRCALDAWQCLALTWWGAPPASWQESKMTPLHFAAQNYNVDLIKALLARGADKKAKNADGKTPFELVPEEDDDAKGRARTRALLA